MRNANIKVCVQKHSNQNPGHDCNYVSLYVRCENLCSKIANHSKFVGTIQFNYW